MCESSIIIIVIDHKPYYKLSLEKWCSPQVNGTRPLPFAWFTLTKINENEALLFGGYNNQQDHRDLYLLQLDIMVISMCYRELILVL